MINTTPNETQKSVLEEYGIVPAPTNNGCYALIKYIREGNLLIGRNQAERIEIVRDLQKEWLDQRVKHMDTGVSGVVVYIFPLSRGAFSNFGTRNLARKREASFVAIIRLNNGRTHPFRLSNLGLVSSPQNI